MKKLILFSLTFIAISSNVYAISDDELAKLCLEVGSNKISEQAKTYGCSIDISKVEVQAIDNSLLNPSAYIWYQVIGDCNGSDKIIKSVQYYQGKCF